MKLRDFIWIDSIIEKLDRKHNIQQNEVYEIFQNKPHFRFVEKGHRPGEDVYASLGQTYGGRYVIVFFVYKKDRRGLILSARNMTSAERRLYERK